MLPRHKLITIAFLLASNVGELLADSTVTTTNFESPSPTVSEPLPDHIETTISEVNSNFAVTFTHRFDSFRTSFTTDLGSIRESVTTDLGYITESVTTDLSSITESTTTDLSSIIESVTALGNSADKLDNDVDSLKKSVAKLLENLKYDHPPDKYETIGCWGLGGTALGIVLGIVLIVIAVYSYYNR